MHSLKSKLTNLLVNTRALFSGFAANVADYYRKNRSLLGNLTNVLTIMAFVFGVIALLVLIWVQVRPIKVADIKVPVATDQASYYPGEEISGIFFGEIYHRGEVRVLREVFCKDYKNIIVPPESARNGDFYDTQSIPRKIEGLSVTIGLLPADIPVGSNCVLQFTNVYNIHTVFGVRHVEYQYYTQNFSIVTRERRQQLECEASGRKDCNFISPDSPNSTEPPVEQVPGTQGNPDNVQPSERQRSQAAPVTNNTTNNTTTNNTTNNPPAEPGPRVVERCAVDFIVRIGCRQETVQ